MAADSGKIKKVPYTISEEMDLGLQAVQKQTGIPVARLVRNGIRKVLAEYGIDVEDNIRMGGWRGKKAVEGEDSSEAPLE